MFKKKQYLEECASLCPFCGQSEAHSIYRERPIGVYLEGEKTPEIEVLSRCGSCSKKWVEFYKLYDVKEIY